MKIFIIRLIILVIASVIGKNLNSSDLNHELSTFLNIGVWFTALYILVLCKKPETFSEIGLTIMVLPLLAFLGITLKYLLYSIPILIVVAIIGSWDKVFVTYNICLAVGSIFELLKMNSITHSAASQNNQNISNNNSLHVKNKALIEEDETYFNDDTENQEKLTEKDKLVLLIKNKFFKLEIDGGEDDFYNHDLTPQMREEISFDKFIQILNHVKIQKKRY